MSACGEVPAQAVMLCKCPYCGCLSHDMWSSRAPQGGGSLGQCGSCAQVFVLPYGAVAVANLVQCVHVLQAHQLQMYGLQMQMHDHAAASAAAAAASAAGRTGGVLSRPNAPHLPGMQQGAARTEEVKGAPRAGARGDDRGKGSRRPKLCSLAAAGHGGSCAPALAGEPAQFVSATSAASAAAGQADCAVAAGSDASAEVRAREIEARVKSECEAEHRAAFQAARALHEAELAAARSVTAEAVSKALTEDRAARARAEHDARGADLEVLVTAKVAELEQAHAAKVADMAKLHAAKVADMAKVHAANMAEMEQAHAAKAAELEQRLAAKVAALEQTLAAKTAAENAQTSKVAALEKTLAAKIAAEKAHAAKTAALEKTLAAKAAVLEKTLADKTAAALEQARVANAALAAALQSAQVAKADMAVMAAAMHRQAKAGPDQRASGAQEKEVAAMQEELAAARAAQAVAERRLAAETSRQQSAVHGDDALLAAMALESGQTRVLSECDRLAQVLRTLADEASAIIRFTPAETGAGAPGGATDGPGSRRCTGADTCTGGGSKTRTSAGAGSACGATGGERNGGGGRGGGGGSWFTTDCGPEHVFVRDTGRCVETLTGLATDAVEWLRATRDHLACLHRSYVAVARELASVAQMVQPSLEPDAQGAVPADGVAAALRTYLVNLRMHVHIYEQVIDEFRGNTVLTDTWQEDEPGPHEPGTCELGEDGQPNVEGSVPGTARAVSCRAPVLRQYDMRRGPAGASGARKDAGAHADRVFESRLFEKAQRLWLIGAEHQFMATSLWHCGSFTCPYVLDRASDLLRVAVATYCQLVDLAVSVSSRAAASSSLAGAVRTDTCARAGPGAVAGAGAEAGHAAGAGDVDVHLAWTTWAVSVAGGHAWLFRHMVAVLHASLPGALRGSSQAAEFWVHMREAVAAAGTWTDREHWRVALEAHGGCPFRVLDSVARVAGRVDVVRGAVLLLRDAFCLACAADAQVGASLENMSAAKQACAKSCAGTYALGGVVDDRALRCAEALACISTRGRRTVQSDSAPEQGPTKTSAVEMRRLADGIRAKFLSVMGSCAPIIMNASDQATMTSLVRTVHTEFSAVDAAIKNCVDCGASSNDQPGPADKPPVTFVIQRMASGTRASGRPKGGARTKNKAKRPSERGGANGGK